MARGQSPYQGRYTVPIADFSPIAQSGRDIGAALASIGGNIASATVKRKELKGKLDTYSKMVKGMEADVELYLDADPEERKRVSSMIKDLDKETRADPSKNLIQKVAAYEAAIPILKNRLDSAFRERKFQADKDYRTQMLEYQKPPPIPTFDPMPQPQGGGLPTPASPDPSSLLPAPTQPQSIDANTLNQLTPNDSTEPLVDVDAINRALGNVPPESTASMVSAETTEKPQLDISWEEYKETQPVGQMKLDDETGQEGGKGVRGVTFSQPLLTPDESISRELANNLGIDIPKVSLREPPPLTPEERHRLDQLQNNPQKFLSHPQAGSAFRTMLATLQAKEKAHSEFPQTQIEHWTKLANLRGALVEMDRESKMPDLSDSGVRAKYIEEESAVYDALGMDATFSWDGGKLAVSIKDVEGAKDMIPLRIRKADGTYDSVPGMYHIEGSSVLHIMDAETKTLVKPTSPEDASNRLFNNVRIWKTVMENIWNSQPVSDIKDTNRLIPINFANFDSMLGTIMRGETTDEEFTRKDFGEKLIKGEFGEGDRSEKGWEIKDGVLEYWTKRGKDTINWQIPINASFKTGVDEWVEYHNAKKGIAGITTAIQLQNGQRGTKGGEGIRGETGIPEFPNNPIQFPRRSYNREEILEQIRK